MSAKYQPLPTDFDALAKEAYKTFSKRIAIYHQLHKLTRRLAVTSTIFIIPSFIYFLSSLDVFSSTSFENISDIGETAIIGLDADSFLSLWPAILICAFSFFFMLIWVRALVTTKMAAQNGKSSRSTENARKNESYIKIIIKDFYQFYYLITIFALTTLIFIDFKTLAPYYFILGSTIFIVSYSVNRKFGYTRAWSRNRLYAERLHVIVARHKSGVIFRDKAMEELLKLIEQYEIQTHQDIVNDYIRYGDSALSSLKGLRK